MTPAARALACLALALWPLAAAAQDELPSFEETPPGDENGSIFEGAEELFGDPDDPFGLNSQGIITEEQRARVASGRGAVLRTLDKLTGAVRDVELASGQSAQIGRLSVTLSDCRYPETNPGGNAYAWLSIRTRDTGQDAFAGWMVAASPALNALEHPRYDVWVLRCIT